MIIKYGFTPDQMGVMAFFTNVNMMSQVRASIVGCVQPFGAHETPGDGSQQDADLAARMKSLRAEFLPSGMGM